MGRVDEPDGEDVGHHVDDSWLQDFVGLPLAAAVAKAESEGRAVRVLRPGSVVTLDFRPDRLNLHLDAAGGLREATAG